MPSTAEIEKTIFLQAAEIEAPSERAAFLDQACAGNPELRAAVDALLASHERTQHLLDATTGQATRPHATQIGPYKLLQQIGEGGMGTVYMAEQSEPVQRRVALKIIKPGMDSRQVIARFEAERQALAMMDHPNIAKVFEAGMTDAGHPYFAMELVHGISITKYCDEHHLTLKARLELFLPVCQAVQHAHQKGIIHRDLKPSNVLVAQYDDRPVPKVIDFGVAKAAQKLTERTMFTEYGQVVGTLEYMSPEQARLNQLDIDTRSDIYSLGVLLYELLTGCTPFDGKRLRSAAFDEMLRIIREEEPPKPSTRLSNPEALPSIAANRDVEPARLSRAIRGDLDWIVMKALEKDRNRRYESASGFAADLHRYLADEPVQACPPSTGYRVRKFVRRNKLALLTGALIAVSLVVGTMVSVWYAMRAMDAELLAEAKQKQAEENFQKARDAVNEYFTLVSQNKLLNAPGLDPLRKDLLEAALRYYEGMLDRQGDNPAVLADIAATHMRVSTIYHRLDRNNDAVAAIDMGLPIVERLLREYAGSHQHQCQLAGVLKFGQPRSRTAMPKDPAAARRTLQKALQLWTALAKENPGVEGFQSDIASLRWLLGLLEGGVGYAGEPERYAQAVVHLRKAVAISESLCAAHPEDINYVHFAITAQGALGWHLSKSGNQLASAKAYARRQELQDLLAVRYPDDLSHQARRASEILNEAFSLISQDPQKAEELCRQALREYETLIAAFPNVVEHQVNQAKCFHGIDEALGSRNDRIQERILCAKQVIAIYKQVLEDFPGEWQALIQAQGHNYRYLAFRLAQNHEYAAARAAFEAASDVFLQCAENASVGERATCFFGRATNSLEIASLWDAEGRSEEARSALREALARYELLLTDGLENHITPGWVNNYHRELALVLERIGTLEDALRFSGELHPPGPELNSTGLRGLSRCYVQIGRILLEAGRKAEAEQALRRAQEVLQGSSPAARAFEPLRSDDDFQKLIDELEAEK